MEKIYYSWKTKGFYIHLEQYSNLPDDLKEISQEDYDAWFGVDFGYEAYWDEETKSPKVRPFVPPTE